jgi:small-conductance mechanosensitive channel
MSRSGTLWPVLATAMLLAGGAVYMIVLSGALPERARLYPQIFLYGILLGSAVLAGSVILDRLRRRSPATGDEAAADRTAQESDRAGWPLFAMLLAYVVLLDRIGFIVATLLFMLPALVWLRTPARTSALLAVAGILGLFVVFRTVMYVSLPAGPVDIYFLELLHGSWRRW